MLRRYLLPLLFALFAGPAAAGSDTWAWFVAKSAIDAWGTESGKQATVRISKQKIFIELTDATGWRHRVEGTINGNNIRAKLSTNETDLENYPLSGKYTKKVWTEPLEGSLGRENIELVGSGVVIGLTREIKQPAIRP